MKNGKWLALLALLLAARGAGILPQSRGLEERNPIPGGLGGQFLATKNLGSLESILRGETDNG